MSILKHPGVIVAPQTDRATVSRYLRRSYLRVWGALILLAVSAVSTIVFLSFPPMHTEMVSKSPLDDSFTVTESGEAITYHETVETTVADFTPFVWSLVGLIVFGAVAVFLYSRMPRALRRRHPDVFAERDILDGYLISTGGLAGPSEPELWDAAQNEYDARDLDETIQRYESAPALSATQESEHENYVTERDNARRLAASILNADD